MTPAAAAALLLGASPSPAPGVVTPPPELITPGTLGFLVTFFVAVAVVLLARDMSRRVRRIRVRAEREEAERRAVTDGEEPDGPGGGVIRRQ